MKKQKAVCLKCDIRPVYMHALCKKCWNEECAADKAEALKHGKSN